MGSVGVVGGGAAGMMAALTAAEYGCKVALYERNEKLGKKIYITGGGRCNLCNDCQTEDIFTQIPRNPKFLYSAVYKFNNRAVMDFFTSHGLKIKTERGGRVFPRSDHASDVTKALERVLRARSVEIHLKTPITGILRKEGRAVGVKTISGAKRHDALVFACGGASYPSTGSDGSAWRICRRVGHSVNPTRPALVPMRTKESYLRRLKGLSLRNVTFSLYAGEREIFREFGEMLFTGEGIGGPLVMKASSAVPDEYFNGELKFEIDLKSALDPEKLDKRILKDFSAAPNKQLKNAVSGLLPGKMMPVLLEYCAVDAEKKVCDIRKDARGRIIDALKHFSGTVTGLSGFDQAVVTRGGISVGEVNPLNMESRLVEGLYFCGEMLDLDAYTGGFNLQIAWSTGHLAGEAAGMRAAQIKE